MTPVELACASYVCGYHRWPFLALREIDFSYLWMPEHMRVAANDEGVAEHGHAVVQPGQGPAPHRYSLNRKSL